MGIPIWTLVGASIVVALTAAAVTILLTEVTGLDTPFTTVTAMAGLVIGLTLVTVAALLPSARGPVWTVLAVAAAGAAVLTIAGRRSRRGSTAPAPVGVCLRCGRELLEDRTGQRYVDQLSRSYLCPEESRDPDHRRHQLLRA